MAEYGSLFRPTDDGLLVTGPQVFCRFSTGTGIPAIFSLTEKSVLRLVKNSVFQSSPPKAMLIGPSAGPKISSTRM